MVRLLIGRLITELKLNNQPALVKMQPQPQSGMLVVTFSIFSFSDLENEILEHYNITFNFNFCCCRS
jgi:hypothetical protein